MKKTLFPIAALFVLAVFFMSCEKESPELIENQSASLVKGLDDQKPEEEVCDSENGMFERQLHWFSATTARVLRYHVNARGEVTNYLSANSTQTIDAETLLGNSFGFPNFKTAFEQEFLYYLNPPDPDTDTERPKVPPTQGGIPDGTNHDFIYDLYLSIIVDDNCTELYFPNSLTLWGMFEITSTTHPLDNQSCNEGILRLHNPPIGGLGNGGNSASLPVIVDDAYLVNNNNVIVARPVRTTSDTLPNDPCLYPQYPGIDFTLFLD